MLSLKAAKFSGTAPATIAYVERTYLVSVTATLISAFDLTKVDSASNKIGSSAFIS